MKRFICVLVCVLLISGCGQKKHEDNTIVLWHWMTDRDHALQELAQKYEQQTGIKVKIDLYAPSDAYTQRIVASAQAKVLPDIYGILDKRTIFASFIQSGYVLDLTPWFKADNGQWENSLFENALDVNRFVEGNPYGVKPGIYGVPIDVTNIQMVYNKKLLRKAGIKNVPQTFDEFLSDVRALNRVGISGMVSGWGEMWMADCFAANYAFNIMGADKVMATFRGEVPYTDPDWIKVFNVFKSLREAHAFVEGIVTKPNKEAEQDFALERAAFAFNGSWCVNVYKDMNPDLDYGFMLPPPIDPERPMKIWVSSSLVVNASSPIKEEAVKFLKWLSAYEQQEYLSRSTNNIPANREAIKNIPAVLADFTKLMEKGSYPNIWPQNELPLVIEKFDKGIQSIIIGEKTPEQVAKEVQDVKQREQQKLKNLK